MISPVNISFFCYYKALLFVLEIYKNDLGNLYFMKIRYVGLGLL